MILLDACSLKPSLVAINGPLSASQRWQNPTILWGELLVNRSGLTGNLQPNSTGSVVQLDHATGQLFINNDLHRKTGIISGRNG